MYKMKILSSEWDNVAMQWNRSMQNGDWFQRNIIYPTLLNTLVNLEGKSVLDVGCGNGHLSRYLRTYQAEVTGIDRSVEMIEMCKRYQSDIEYLAFDITSDKLPNKKFDYIIFNNSIQDIRDYIKGIKHASLLLKRGGKLIICVKHPCFHPTGKDMGWFIEKVDGSTAFTGPGLTGLVQADIRYQGKYFVTEDYLNCFEHVREWYGEKTVSYSRTVSAYCDALIGCGLKLIKIEEPKPLQAGEEENPDLYSLLLRIPNFIFFTARK